MLTDAGRRVYHQREERQAELDLDAIKDAARGIEEGETFDECAERHWVLERVVTPKVVVSLVERVRALEQRQQELLATIVRLTNEVPFPDEVKDWVAQRAALVAEVGSLRARVAELERRDGGEL